MACTCEGPKVCVTCVVDIVKAKDARIAELEYKLDSVERCVTYGLATYSVDVGGIIKALSPRRLLPDHYHVVSGILDSKET